LWIYPNWFLPQKQGRIIRRSPELCSSCLGPLKVKCGVVRKSLVLNASPSGEVQPFYFVLGVVQHMAQNIRWKDEQVQN
jgi:hypothetical protein